MGTLGCYYLFGDERIVGVLLKISIALRLFLCASYTMILGSCMFFHASGVDGGAAYVSLFLPSFVFIIPSNVFSASDLKNILAKHNHRQKQQAVKCQGQEQSSV